MTLEKLIKEINKCYDKRQQDFYADIPAELGFDILEHLNEFKKLKKIKK